MSTKTRKPRLTRAMALKLQALSSLVTGDAEDLQESPDPNQRRQAKVIWAAIGYIDSLAYWKLKQDTTP